MRNRRSALPAFQPEREYYEYVAQGYDLIADTYDEVEAQNAVGRRLRRRMQAMLQETFQPGDRVLEIGCGTGIEATTLAERGIEVLATDVSAKMVEKAQARAKAAKVHSVAFRKLAAHEVGNLIDEYGKSSFDGGYSHAGALNMDPSLHRAATGLRRLIRQEGHFVCSVVNHASLFETLFYPFVLKPRKGYRRLGNVIPIPITRFEDYSSYVVPTRFYSPNAFLRVFRGGFRLHAMEGLQIFLPPWNLSDYVDQFQIAARALEAMEDRLARTRPFNSWGALFLANLVRTGA